MAIKYLDAKRLQGTNAERTALSFISSSIGNVATCKVVGATAETSPTPPSGLGSTSLEFNGSTDYCDGYGLRDAMGTKGSISFWFNLVAEAEGIVMGFADSGSNTKFECATRTNRKLGIQIKIDGTAKWEVTADTFYNSYGNWNHIVITHDAITPRIYINGVESSYTWATDTDKTSWWTALRTADADGIAIGCKPRLNGASRTEFFGDGSITNIAFWDEDLPIGTDETTAGSIKWLYNNGDGKLADTIPTNQTAYFKCQAVEDGTFELGDLSWDGESAPTYEGDNNNNGTIVDQDVSYIRGLRAKGTILYLKKVGTMTGTAIVGVWSGSNSGSTKTLVGSSSDITSSEANALSSSTHTAVTRYFTERTLVTNDTIALQCNTADGFNSTNNISWEYDSGSPGQTGQWDGGNTKRNRFTSGSWQPTSSDMHMAIITESDALVNYASVSNTYPDLPNGTIFNETDAYKYFIWNGTDTWNQMVSS